MTYLEATQIEDRSKMVKNDYSHFSPRRPRIPARRNGSAREYVKSSICTRKLLPQPVILKTAWAGNSEAV